MLRKLHDMYFSFGNYLLQQHYKKQIKISNPNYFFNDKVRQCTKPLIVVCGPGFEQGFTIASSLMREGFATGWSQTIGYAKLISVFDLESEIDKHDNPAIFLSCYDFVFFSKILLRKLQSFDTFVWVSIHPRMFKKYEEFVKFDPNNNDFEIWGKAYPKILSCEPNFVWNSTCKDKFHWYQGWQDDGLKWETIHPAINDRIYYPDYSATKFNNIKMAYVGGYWIDKAQAFEPYFRPHEKYFHPFGYSKWPFMNFGGQLTLAEERQLYSTSGIIPLVTSPSGWIIGEITERYLKAPACKAFCISDENPAIREVFSKNEFLMASNSDEFHFLVNEFLNDRIDTEEWRKKGYEAVIQRHLYKNRAEQIMSALTI